MQRRDLLPAAPGATVQTGKDWGRTLPWIDAGAAGSVGLLMLALAGPLSSLYSLPRSVVLFVAAVNVGYSAFGIGLGSIPRQATVVRRAILMALVVANLAWLISCIALAVRFRGEATFFGLAHLLGEGVFVGTLAALEWKHRRSILAQSPEKSVGAPRTW